MKKILTLLFVTLTAITLVGCDHDDSKTVYEYENTTKTIFVYMPWTGSTLSSITELLQITST